MSGFVDGLGSEFVLATEWLLALIGAVPPVVTGLVQWGRWIGRRIGGHRVLRLQRHSTVDLVVTTSAVVPSSHGAPVSRPTTGHGQIVGMMHAVRSISRLYGRATRPSVHFSARIGRHQLDRDLVVLGGPAKNQVTAQLLAALTRRYPSTEVTFDDVRGSIGFAGRTVAEGAVDPGRQDIEDDHALIVGMPNPFDSAGGSRALLCCGFTSYGTAAAAELLFERLTSLRTRSRLMAFRPIPRRWPRDFAMIVHIADPVGSGTQVTVLGLLDLARNRAAWRTS